MRLPRYASAADLIKALKGHGYVPTRQTGSHVRLTTERNGQHHVTVPNHDPLKLGTLSAIISDVATHLGVTKDEIAREL